MSAVPHRHIIEIHDLGFGVVPAGVDGARVEGGWLALEWADGGCLDPAALGSWSAIAEVLGCVLDALGAAHARGVLHRDVKPQNLLRSVTGDPRARWKLSDFGLAHVRGEGLRGGGRGGRWRRSSWRDGPAARVPGRTCTRWARSGGCCRRDRRRSARTPPGPVAGFPPFDPASRCPGAWVTGSGGSSSRRSRSGRTALPRPWPDSPPSRTRRSTHRRRAQPLGPGSPAPPRPSPSTTSSTRPRSAPPSTRRPGGDGCPTPLPHPRSSSRSPSLCRTRVEGCSPGASSRSWDARRSSDGCGTR
jgi:serine/threonine protein kinase